MRLQKQVSHHSPSSPLTRLTPVFLSFLQWALHTKGLLLASIPFAFNWNQERIPNEVIHQQLDAIDYVHQLHDGTLVCPECSLRRVIDRRVEGINYCRCRNGSCKTTTVMDEWEPYLERDNIIIWRRPEGGRNAGQFAYKVYGRYDDVTAEDFFFVQTDVEYRKVWDSSALTLDIVDTDQATGSNSNVLYWELLWPVSYVIVIRLQSLNFSFSPRRRNSSRTGTLSSSGGHSWTRRAT